MFLLGSAYTQFYMRPSFLTTYLRVGAPHVQSLSRRLDTKIRQRHARELALMERSLSCCGRADRPQLLS